MPPPFPPARVSDRHKTQVYLSRAGARVPALSLSVSLSPAKRASHRPCLEQIAVVASYIAGVRRVVPNGICTSGEGVVITYMRREGGETFGLQTKKT